MIDRYWFKEDGTGYLDHRRQHLYVFDIATGKSELLTPGAHDEYLPEWSPDGKQIAYVTKRGGGPDRHFNWDIYLIEPRASAAERRLTSFEGAYLSPDWEVTAGMVLGRQSHCLPAGRHRPGSLLRAVPARGHRCHDRCRDHSRGYRPFYK